MELVGSPWWLKINGLSSFSLIIVQSCVNGNVNLTLLLEMSLFSAVWLVPNAYLDATLKFCCTENRSDEARSLIFTELDKNEVYFRRPYLIH